jgi:hypothetical protein
MPAMFECLSYTFQRDYYSGNTTDKSSLQGVKDLRTCLGSIGLHALPRIRAVSRAVKHPSGARPSKCIIIILGLGFQGPRADQARKSNVLIWSAVNAQQSYIHMRWNVICNDGFGIAGDAGSQEKVGRIAAKTRFIVTQTVLS